MKWKLGIFSYLRTNTSSFHKHGWAPTIMRVIWADHARRVGRVEDLARALPKLIDLHLQRRLLSPAGGQARLHSPIGRMVEYIVSLYCCFSLLLVPVPSLSTQCQLSNTMKRTSVLRLCASQEVCKQVL